MLNAIGITYTEVQCLRLQRLVMKAVLKEIFKAAGVPTSQKLSQAIDMSVSEDDDDNLNFENPNDDNPSDDNLNDDNSNDGNPKNGNPNDDNSNDDNPNDDNPPSDDNPNDDNNDNDDNSSDDIPNDDNNDDVQGALVLTVKFFAVKVLLIQII